jgi:putative ABC transport system substrate-binding protein
VRGLPASRTSACRWAALALAGALLGSAAFGAETQTAPKPYRIGVVTEAWAANHPTVLGLKAGLHELGLEEGRDVAFDVRFAQGDPEATPAAAKALVESGVDLLFSTGVASTLAAKAATDKLPIVFAQVNDPKAAGIVSELARPGRNVTGISTLATELTPKRLEMLKTLQPQARRVWFVYARGDVTADAALARLRDAAPLFGVEVVSRQVGTPKDVAEIGHELRPGDMLLAADMDSLDVPVALLKLSLAERVPAVFSSSFWVGYGGLVSYGPDYFAQGTQAARLVAKIIGGARAGQLPVEGVDVIDLAVNLQTASLLDVSVPRKVLLRADTIRR